jgi:ribosomal protein S1
MLELKEGVNIGSLPDPFPFLTNSNQILKVKDDISNLNEDYQKLYNMMEKNYLDINEIKENEIIKGVIISKNEKEIVVDFGYKDYIYVESPKGRLASNLEIGSDIDVLITEIQDVPFLIKGSITELIRMNVHNKLKKYYEEKLPLIAKIKELIPAGYMLDIYMDNITIDAFMPNTLADVNKLSDPESILGETLNVMLETLQQEKGVYVVSRRKYLKTLIPQEIKKLKKDTVYTGEVTGTTPFGVFVQFNNCLTGMIHKMNVNEEWQKKWSAIQPGMAIDFYVKEITKSKKIILTQVLKDSLWDKIKVGKVLDGKVIDVKNFGALISLDYETMGLIQTTYLSKSNSNLKKGDQVKVKVISVIKDDRKIYLNLAK